MNRIECRSTYRWDGDLVEDDESILLAKTTNARYDDLLSFLTEEHPYDVPCNERDDEAEIFAPFGAWLDAITNA